MRTLTRNFYDYLIAYHLEMGAARGWLNTTLLDDIVQTRAYDFGLDLVSVMRALVAARQLHAGVKRRADEIRALAGKFESGEITREEFAKKGADLFQEMQDNVTDIMLVEASIVGSGGQ